MKSGFSEPNALLVSLGTGIVNFLFAIPAIYTIDTFGRRNLLLTTFPMMAFFLVFGGLSFLIPNEEGKINISGTVQEGAAQPSTAQLGCIAAAIYGFMVVYSPGEGPVPFTYSAEAFPLYIRDVGMSFATGKTPTLQLSSVRSNCSAAVTWGFNFILALTWPALSEAFTPLGAFLWYAACTYPPLRPSKTSAMPNRSNREHVRLGLLLLLTPGDQESDAGGTGRRVQYRQPRALQVLLREGAVVLCTPHAQRCPAL